MNKEQVHALEVLDSLSKNTGKTRASKYIISSLELVSIADRELFEKSLFKNLAFDISFHFADAFDIIPTERIVKTEKLIDGVRKTVKASQKFYTQGGNFNFARGLTIYDHKPVESTWAESLQKIKHIIQIYEATPADIASNFKGKVVFDIFTPILTEEEKTTKFVKRIEVTQYDFARILITGENLTY